jgi:hypothetical protein
MLIPRDAQGRGPFCIPTFFTEEANRRVPKVSCQDQLNSDSLGDFMSMFEKWHQEKPRQGKKTHPPFRRVPGK